MVGNGRSVHTTGRAAAVAARGHEVRLVTLGPTRPAAGVDVRTRPLPRGSLDAVRAARGFLADIGSFAPDVLHLHYAGGRLGTLATLAAARPLVVTVMGGDVLPEQHPGGLPPLERRATRRILEQADLILVKADGLRPAVARFGPLRAPIEIVRWGVDPAVFRRDAGAAEAMRARLGLGARDRVLLSPRILQRLYNVHLAVEAMPAVLARVPEAVLLVTEYAADAAYRAGIEDRIGALGLGDRVRLVGVIDHSDMPALYSLAEVVVQVPSSDGLPQSLFEAMACEAPSVLSPLPAYAEVVRPGETALVAEAAPASIAEQVARILEDAGLREALAAAGLARVREVASLPREAARVEALYRSLVAGPRRRRARGPGWLLDALSLALRA
jgi:glycosyltransferase involved in cell wall biosynthesis